MGNFALKSSLVTLLIEYKNLEISIQNNKMVSSTKFIAMAKPENPNQPKWIKFNIWDMDSKVKGQS